MTADELSSDKGVSLIVNTIYQRDPISVVSEVFKDFTELVITRRGQNEAFKNFESRYAAQLSKFNANGSSVCFPEALAALMLLSNAGVDDSQRISIISSVATSSSDKIEDGSNNDAYITGIRYSSVASILRQCDRLRSKSQSDQPNGANTITLNLANTVRPPRRNGNGNSTTRPTPNHNRNKNKLKTTQLADLKSKSQCHICKMYGHWSTDHHQDGSLKSNVRSVPAPVYNSAPAPVQTSTGTASQQSTQTSSNSRTMQFGLAYLLPDQSSNHAPCSNNHKKLPKIRLTRLYDSSSNVPDPPAPPVQDSRSKAMSHSWQFDTIVPDPRFQRSDTLISRPESDSESEEWYQSSSDSDTSESSETFRAHLAYFNDPDQTDLGPMVDDGAPYSALGIVELALVCQPRSDSIEDLITPLPESISQFRFWQFGSGKHASPAKPIRGSVMLNFKSDSGSLISIRHVVVDGSSPWVLGRNITRKCDIVHIGGNFIRFPPSSDGVSDTLTMIDFDLHRYVPITNTSPSVNSPSVVTLAGFRAQIETLKQVPVTNRSWPQLKRIVDRVHNHTCGHASFADVRSLLERNGFWTPAVSHYLTDLINKLSLIHI